MKASHFLPLAAAGFVFAAVLAADAPKAGITLSWDNNMLTIHDGRVPGAKIEVWYLEAYCRAGSTDREWDQTVIGHTTELVSRGDDGKRLELRCMLKDGVTVRHVIEAAGDEVHFHVKAHNPTDKASEAHWAQPCMRVGEFTGGDQETYIENCFIFLDGALARMPTKGWATEARYTPGQVWAGPGVNRDDVNPRPVNPHTPSNGLIGCFSGDGKWILAMAWEPYQELFQGVIRCIHSDFRIGGLKPGETKEARGRVYIVPNDVEGLLKRHERDFP